MNWPDRAVLAGGFESAFHRHYQRPVPANLALFYCGRIPVSEHPAESNIRGAAIIDKNGCLVAAPANKTVAYASTRVSVYIFLLLSSVLGESNNGEWRVHGVPTVRRYAELFRTTAARRDE